MGFPKVVRDYQAPGVEGDFASTNPFTSVVAGPGALVAPAGGLRVGNFAWVGPSGQVSQSYVAGWQLGFLGRNQQGLLTDFLADAGMQVPEGFMITLFNRGDFWARFGAGATPGQNVYAEPNTGSPLAGATAPTLGTVTASAGFVGTGTLVINTPVLTVVAATDGIVSPGDTVAGTDIPVGTTILNQLTGTPGKAGTYTMSANATATVSSAEAVTTTSAQLLVTAVADGSLNTGDELSGTDVISGTRVVFQVPAFAGTGTIVTGSLSTLVIGSVTPGTDLLRVGAVLPAIPQLGIAAGTTITAQTAGTPGGVGSYTLSAAGTVGASVPVTTEDSAGGTGLYVISTAQQFDPTTVTVPGTAQPTGFTVRGTYTATAGQLAKISA